MNQETTFAIPDVDTYSASLADEWVESLSRWLSKYGLGRIETDDEGFMVVTKRGVSLEPTGGDVLVNDNGRLRFASMEELVVLRDSLQSKPAEPETYELVFTSADSMVRTVYITADSVEANDHYLMFTLNGGLVTAVAHATVREFSSVAAQEGNIHTDAELAVSIEDAQDRRIANRFMP